MKIYYPTENLTDRTGKAYGTAIYDFLSTNELATEFFDVTVEAATSTSDYKSDTICLTAKTENLSGLKIKLRTDANGADRYILYSLLYNEKYYIQLNMNVSPSTLEHSAYIDTNKFQSDIPIYLSRTVNNGIYIAFGSLINCMTITPKMNFMNELQNEYTSVQSKYQTFSVDRGVYYYMYLNGTAPIIKKADEYFYNDNVGYSNNRMIIPLSRNGYTFADIYLIDGGMTLPSQGVYKINGVTYAIIQGNIAVALAEED